jgi:hypothetical protein
MMIDIPLGKALIVEKGLLCKNCCFYEGLCDDNSKCSRDDRKDGKDVIYKLVDYPAKEEVNGTHSSNL